MKMVHSISNDIGTCPFHFARAFFCEKRLDVFHKIGCDRLRSNQTVMTVWLENNK